MEEKILKSPVDGRTINIEGLNRWQLRDIHYQEEIKMAKRILQLPPFSEERKLLLNQGYAFVETLKLYYEKSDIAESFGASPITVNVLEEILKARIQNVGTKQVLYEAGVGRGYAIRRIMETPDIIYYGCDVTLFEEVEELCNQYSNLILHERTLYEDLIQMADNSIDVFYADNVIEHLIPDEAEKIFKVLFRKMKKGGMLVLFIPNWNNGPHDVSKYYLSRGHKATGFHFMEMSYFETISVLVRNGFKPNYIYKNGAVEKDSFYIKNIRKMLTEKVISQIKNKEVRFGLMNCDNYSAYILSK